MTLRSTARATYHVALDFWGCLRRFVDGKAVNGYDDHVAGVLAEAAETERCARETGPTSTPEKHGPGSRPSGPILQRESIAAGATLSNEARERLSDSVFRSGGQTYDMGPRPKLSTPGPKITGAVQAAAAAVSEATAQRFADLEARVARLTDNQISAAPVLRPDDSADSPAHGSPSPEACAGHPPTFTAAELVDAAGAVTRMALVRGIASRNVAYWLALSAKFYDAADAIGDASAPPEYTTQLATIGREALLETLANDPRVDTEIDEDQGARRTVPRVCCQSNFGDMHAPECGFHPRKDQPLDYGGPAVVLDGADSVHDRTLRQRLDEDERQK